MTSKIILNYQVTNTEYIEAKQLDLVKSISSWLNLACVIGFCVDGLLELKKITKTDFLIFGYFQQLFLSEQIPPDNHLLSSLSYFGIALFFSDSNYTVPKYNPIYRWMLSRQYQHNFVKQETQNVVIDDNQISINSDSYRRTIQWQDFAKFKENKYIFLLYGSRNKIIIPKGVFLTSEEIQNTRAILESNIDKE